MEDVTTKQAPPPAPALGVLPPEPADPLKVPEPVVEPPKELTPEEKLVESLKGYPFLKFENNILSVKHSEYEALLKPKILKMGDLVRRGNILTGLNGGVSRPDDQSATLNGCIATVQVGFENLSLDLLKVTDEELLLGLYIAVRDYNSFFRKTPLSFIL